MSSLSLLNNRNFRIYNSQLAHKLGSIHAAIFLYELIIRYEYHKEKDTDVFLNFDGKEWFYLTHEKAHERLAMTRKEQDSAIKVLIKHELIKKTQKGLPARRYFWLDHQKLFNQKEII